MVKWKLASALMSASGLALADHVTDSYQNKIVVGPYNAYRLQVTERTAVPDGIVGTDEYSVSVEGGMFRIVGEDRLRNFLDRRPSKAYYAWDATNLYVAVVTDAKGPLTVTATERDTTAWADDGVEICVTTARTKTSKRYQMAINSKGVIYDRCCHDIKWNVEGLVSAGKVADGKWTFEAAVPWASVGIEPAEDAEILANLSRTYVEKDGPYYTSLSRGGYCNGDTMPFIVLKRKAPRYAIGPIGDPSLGRVDVPFRVISDRDELFTLATAAVGMESAKLDLHQRHEAKVGERFTFESRGQAPSSGVFYFFFRDKDFKTIASVGAAYVDSKPFSYLVLTTSPDGQTMFMHSMNNVSDRGCRLRFEFRDWATDAVKLYETEVAVPPLVGRSVLPVDVSRLPEGYCYVHYSFVDATGKVLVEDREYYMKESGKGSWGGCTAGDEDTVPSPWTAPRFERGGFGCWGREIRFGGEGLVSSIVSAGGEILSRPIAVKLNGKSVPLSSALVDRKVSYADYAFTSADGRIALTARAEFDGYIRFGLSYTGRVDSLDVEFPLRRAGVIGFDDGATCLEKLALPQGKTGHWERNPAKCPCYWIGDAKSGLMLGADSLKGRHLKNKRGGVTLDVDGREAVITFKIVDTPFVSEGRTAVFYINATPARPRNAELARVPEKDIQLWTGHPWRFFETKVPGEGFMRPDKIAPYLNMVHRGKRVFWYFGSHGMSSVAPQWGRFGAEWTYFNDPSKAIEEVKSTTREVRDRGRWTVGCLNGQNFFDYKIWTIDWFVNRSPYTNEVKDLYFDLAYPYECKNVTHDCTWKDEFGDVLHDWTSGACREFHKRVRRVLLKKNPKAAMLGHINSSRSPGDIYFDRYAMGEVFERYVRERASYFDVMSPEVMQLGYASRSCEAIVSVLPQIYRMFQVFARDRLAQYDPEKPEYRRAIRHFMGYLMTHDLTPCNVQKKDGEEMTLLPEAVRSLGEDRSFSAYYHADCPVSVSGGNERLLYSLYLAKDGRRLLTVLNDTDETVEVAVKGVAGEGRDILDGTRHDVGKTPLRLGAREARFFAFDF